MTDRVQCACSTRTPWRFDVFFVERNELAYDEYLWTQLTCQGGAGFLRRNYHRRAWQGRLAAV